MATILVLITLSIATSTSISIATTAVAAAATITQCPALLPMRAATGYFSLKIIGS